jgi:class 3 adenylate cyclase
MKRRIRFSLRWKITLPFIFLALVLGLGAAFLVNRLLNQTEEAQFLRQLADSGKQATDAVVRVEIDLLEVERLIANTEGVAQAVGLQNAEELRARVLPLVINAGVDVAVVLDSDSVSLLTIRHQLGGGAGDYEVIRGETFYSEWDFVQRILSGEGDAIGDKWVGMELIPVEGGEEGVFFIGGSLRDNQGRIIGAALVGEYLDSLAMVLSNAAGANVSIYHDVTGELLSSSLEPEMPKALTLSDSDISIVASSSTSQSLVRAMTIADSAYSEVLTEFEARQGTAKLGILGISLLQSEVQSALLDNVLLVGRYGAVALVLVVVIGLIISNTITRPIVEIAEASAQVAAGNLETQVSTRARDEIGVLADSFNTLVRGLRRATPGYEVLSPPWEEQGEGDLTKRREPTLLYDGQMVESTILSADLRSFVHGVEESDPKLIFSTVSECYTALIPVITQHQGEISQFDGVTLVAYFGVLPERTSPQLGALQAVHAGLETLAFVERWNGQRAQRGLPALEMWIGISSGPVIVGNIGNMSQLQYVVIGDTVQVARDVQEVSRELGGGALLITETTFKHLQKYQEQFKFGRQGQARLRYSGETLRVHEVSGRRTRYVHRSRRGGVAWKEGQDTLG